MLNAHYAALRVISVRRAFALLFKRTVFDDPMAEVVHVENGQFVTYDFDDWCELSILQFEAATIQQDWIRTVRFALAVPRVIRVLTYDRVARQPVKLNRRNIFARDRSLCQYCGRGFPNKELSLDHVIPRSGNGPHTWENVVCCCLKCNVAKGGRTPERAGMRLIAKPVRPARNPVFTVKLSDEKYHSWRHFLDHRH